MKSVMWQLVAAVATAVLLTSALPPLGLFPLAWFALVPVLVASKGLGFLRGFLCGIVASLTVGWLAVSGFLYPAQSFTGDSTWTYLACAMFGFVLATCCGIVGEVKSDRFYPWMAIAAVATLLEFFLMPVMPATIAVSQARWPGFLAISSVTGIWGVAFLVWAINGTIAYHLRARNFCMAIYALMLFTVLTNVPHLFVLLHRSPETTMTVGVVQSEPSDLETMAQLTRKTNAHIAVWPEFGGLLYVQNGDAQTLIDLAKRPGMPAIVTSFPDGALPLSHNAAAMYSAEGESKRYWKRKLFGGETKMHTPGTNPVAAGNVGLNICFDSCFPGMMRETARLPNVELIALPTIDPESPHGWLAAMHAAFTPFRAAELGIPIVRADANAHSMIVDNDGHVLVDLPVGQPLTASAQVHTSSRWTFYRLAGDWFLWVCGGIIVAAIVQKRRLRSGETETPSEILTDK